MPNCLQYGPIFNKETKIKFPVTGKCEHNINKASKPGGHIVQHRICFRHLNIQLEQTCQRKHKHCYNP